MYCEPGSSAKMVVGKTSWLIAACAVVVMNPVGAQEIEDPDVTELERVVVVAAKAERPLREVAGIVDIVTSGDLDARLARDVDDIVRYEPGISMNREPGRFGNGGFTIRGIGGNRVVTEIDGVPVSDSFLIGDFSNAGRDLVDPEILKRVEILRGPASALYGSDALGGVIAFTTVDPRDLVVGTSGYQAVKAGYGTADESWHGSAYFADINDSLDWLAVVSTHAGHELEAEGTRANPADYDNISTLLKFVHYTEPGDALRVTLDVDDGSRQTDVASLVNGPGRYATTTRMEGDDSFQRLRASLSGEWSINHALADDAVWRVFRQDSEVDQLTLQELLPDATYPAGSRRERRFTYMQDVTGGEFTAEKLLDTRLSQRLVYGVELTNTRTEEMREGQVTNLDDQATSETILGETFPLRDFPVTDVREVGIYLQDEISFQKGTWTLIPALRFEMYELDPRDDAIYREDNPSTTPAALEENRLTPRLAVVHQLGRADSVYMQYAEGFRAPPFEDVNIGLDIPMFQIRAVPNPDLKPETSRNFEMGWRHDDGIFSWEAGLFYGDLDNLIDSRVPIGIDPVTGFLLFQSVNRDEARIHGAEIRFSWRAGRQFDALDGWRFDVATSVTRGVDTVRDVWLNSVEPDSAVFNAHFDSPSARWNADIYWTIVDAKQRLDESEASFYRTDGHSLVDAYVSFIASENWKLQAGIQNLADKQYWRWSDVRGVAPDDPLLPLYAAPGRTFRLAAKVEF